MMSMLFSAIVLASVLGSTHCVGMCGPLALWASGALDQSRQKVLANTSLYHLGRLFTYAMMGLLAGGIGELVTSAAKQSAFGWSRHESSVAS
ncbi:MAG: sulfite exporter TauE/SafE family protein [Planctomycetota bacterium]